jgi:predicted site-specific integrase-resolvase
MSKLLVPQEVDRILRYPRGRASRLAREGKIPCIILPDGELRFDETEINRLLTNTSIKSFQNDAQAAGQGAGSAA